MADGLLSSALGLIDRAKQSAKANIGLLFSNPQEFATQAAAKYFPTKDEELQYRAVEQAGGDVTQTPYYQKIFGLAQFQGSIKPVKGLPTYEQAHQIAQKNATEMLGLPPNNTAMDRAKALGFDTDVYHATGSEFNNFVVNPYRGSFFVGNTADNAFSGANAGLGDRMGIGSPNRILPLVTKSSDIQGLSLSKAQRDWLSKLPNEATESQVENLMKTAPKNSGYWMQWFNEVQKPDGTFTYIKKPEMRKTYEQAIKTGKDLLGRRFSDYSNASNERFSAEMARNDGFKGYLQNDEAGLSMAISDPSIIRSRFAAFDPARVNEADLLAAGVPLGLLAGANEVVKTPDKRKTKK